MTRLERAASDLALAEDALAKARQRATDEVERWYAAMMAQRRREYQDALREKALASEWAAANIAER